MSWHCSKCKVVLTDENGYRRKTGIRAGEFTGTCKKCSCQSSIDWCKNNREKANAKQKRTYQRNRQWVSKAACERRAKLNLLKMDRPCYDCGGVFPPECMHIPGKEKLFQISKGISYPLEKVIDEIAKCQLVCSNCHLCRTVARNRDKHGIDKGIFSGTLV
jgi:hypothetical protein